MFNFLRNLADVLEKSSFGFMGILFCCIRPRVDEDDDFVPNEASNDTNNRSGDDSTSSLLQDISNRANDVLARGATDDKRFRRYSQVETQQRKPEPEPKPKPQELRPQQQQERVLVSEAKQEQLEPQSQRQQEHVLVSEPKQEPILESQELELEPKQQIQAPVLESEELIIHKSVQRGEYVQHNKEECFICFEVYTIEQPRTRFKCSHYCHLGCILAWQEISALCPMCLKVLELDDEEEKSDPETLLPSTSQA